MSNTLKVYSAYQQELIAELPLLDDSAIDKALTTARTLADDKHNQLPAWERHSILKRAAELMLEHRNTLAQQAAREGGKPWADTMVEVNRAIEGVKLAAEAINSLTGSPVPMGHTPASAHRLAHTSREPIGVVVAISAFNHPLNLIVHQVATAVAAGCPVIVKPAGTTPLSCIAFRDILIDAGLPTDWCQVALCKAPVAESLATDPRVNFLSFIGSGRVGWSLRSKIAPGTRCALEHGGVAPAIIEPDADLKKVVPSLTKGGFYHAGQVCVSVQRVYIQQTILYQLAELLKEAAEQLIVGDPLEHETQVGPLITPNEVQRVHQWVEEAIEEGASLLCGGEILSETTYAPTILLSPNKNSKVSTQEVFGPVLCLYGYENLDHAIQDANGLNVAFQSSIFTQDIDTAMQAASQLDATAVMINDHTAFRVDWMPFGGRKTSGLGLGGIEQTVHDMTQEKMILINYSTE
ncbi:aldehyde dehydrogenase family protein [Rubritalea tangerina]|uniref:Aldehyde dehydrogenase family protein n=1 Tax=Rubritalea tangerina TaxID=430798 RepID=A0ABW4Z9M1_9BACT